MRDPRFRFGDDVRAATREMSAEMARQGASPQAATELESWISADPAMRQRLAAGGYGTRFSSEDLFPLLRVFLAQHLPPPAPVRPPVRAFSWPVAIGLLLLFVLIVWAALGAAVP